MIDLAMNRLGVLRSAAAVAVLACGGGALAQSISAVSVENTSSAEQSAPLATFTTNSTLYPPSLDGAIASVTHRMAARNRRIAAGNAAQVNKRNVIFQMDFTVLDPANLGFRLSVESVIRGISAVEQSGVAEGSTAFATGLVYSVTWDDSTDDPETYSTLGLLQGGGTPILYISASESAAELQEDTRAGNLGVYVGDTTFSFRFTSVTTPTTNLLFGNFVIGEGLVEYGVGPLPPGFEDVSAADLGHFLTFRALFLLAGDTNADGLVNFNDLNDILSNFGASGAPDFIGADLNGDGVVNFADLNIVLGNFGAALN
jgi:hypothetical protein